MKSSTQITESRLLGSISAQSILNLLPRSVSKKKHQKMKSIHPSLECDVDRENIPPIDPNVQIDKPLVSPSITQPKKTQLKSVSFQKDSSTVSERQEEEDKSAAIPPDPAVKVVVRIRPVIWRENGCHATVKKVSPNSLSVADRLFTFDSVFDSSSTQEDLFQLVGVPVVKNSLAGFNTSVLLYGQTGSGKTHTIWGPPSAMVEGHSPSTNQGIGPRIFKMLFSEIQKEQEISGDKQINHQCRCSFLEIYNGHIGDLLDPTQRNLEIRDDAKNGFYVENLTEEYVTNYDDVTQILIKGLANRKVGATSINSKSSRSHIVFSCVVESWCKGTSSSTCFSSSKTSRISLIDLAGSERNKLDDAGRQCVKESRNVKKSLSQLGNLVNVLAEGAQSGKHPRIPYKSSCLTHLLRESIGGNAKLTVICAVSPDEKCNGETLSTLRFGQRAQCIQNEPVINEITENDVNDLSDQIRQLKEELIKTKSTGYNSVGSNSEYFKGRNARESLNQLRISLNRSLILPHIDNDSDEEINVGEEDVTDLCNQLQNSTEENSKDHPSDDKESFHSFEDSSDTELTNECTSRMMACPEENKFEETHWEEPDCELLCRENGGSVASPDTSTTTDRMMACPEENKFEETLWEEPDCKLLCRENGGSVASQDTSTTSDLAFRNSLSVIPCLQSSVLQDPTLSESPKFEKAQKKTVSISLNNLASQNHVSESSKFSSVGLRQSVRRSDHIRASLRSSKVLSGPTESLEASLHRGLQIIDNHQRNSVSNKASVSFSFDHFALKPCQEIEKSDAGVQTLPEEGADLDGQDRSFICATCKRAGNDFSDQAQDNYNTSVVPVDGAGTPKCDQLAEDTQKALAEALKREEDLENVCTEQIAKIEQLNLLVEEYKLQRGCSPVIGQEHVEPFTDTVEPMKNLKKDEHSSSQEVNLQRLDNENQPDLRENNKLMELQKEMDHDYKSVSFHMSERETLLNEIESLRNRLQYYTDTSSSESQSAQLIKTDADHSLDKAGEELEKERQRWTEMESEWISLTDELRIDIESNRRHAEKLETDLRVEKKVTEELDDALDRSVLGHARIVEHYVELQEKYNELLGRHRSIMGGIAEVKKAAAKAGARGNSSRFVKSLAAELSALRAEKEKERERLKKENRSLKMQLRDTAEAVHAAGELLVRLREAEHAVSVAEENHMSAQKETEKVKKQLEKQKRKHAMEMVTMKQYLADSRLPESALRPLYWQEEDRADGSNTQSTPEDDQSWRAEFGAIYQEHY